MNDSTRTKTVLRLRNRDTIHVDRPVEIDVNARIVKSPDAETEDVKFDDLKAVFFFGSRQQAPSRASHLTIEFDDGEVIRGIAAEYNPTVAGFYLYPEEDERIQKVFVVTSAIASIDVDRI